MSSAAPSNSNNSNSNNNSSNNNNSNIITNDNKRKHRLRPWKKRVGKLVTRGRGISVDYGTGNDPSERHSHHNSNNRNSNNISNNISNNSNSNNNSANATAAGIGDDGNTATALLAHHQLQSSTAQQLLLAATSGGTSSARLSSSSSPSTLSGDSQVVASLERILRQVAIVLGAYCLGVGYPKAYPYAIRAVEYLGIAWITCMVLLGMSHYTNTTATTVRGQQAKNQQQQQQQGTVLIPSRDEELAPLLGNDQQHAMLPDYGDRAMVLHQQDDAIDGDVDIATDDDDDDDDDDEESYNEDLEAQSQRNLFENQQENQQQQQAHPALENLYIINTTSGQRCVPNAMEPIFELDNELFYGRMMVMIRTPDVGDSSAVQGTPQNTQQFVSYFSDKQRRWEFQWQIRLKKKPEGQVYFCCELEKSVKMGVLQRAFCGAAMAFCQKMSAAFHYSMTGSTSPDGEVELPHMAFGVERSMTRIVVTKPGMESPELGKELPEEDAEHFKRRTKTGFVDWNTEDTYTMAVWTAYFDFLQWKSLNFPGIKPFSLSSVVGPQPIRLSLYAMSSSSKGEDPKEKHYQSRITRCADLEISNSNEIAPGPAAKKWIAEEKNRSTLRSAPESNSPAVDVYFSRDIADAESVDDIDDDMFLEEQTVAELGEGLYLRTGEAVVLNVTSPDKEVDGFISNGGGFAVVQQNTSAMVVFEKPTKSLKRKSRPSLLIRCGDVVMIKLVLTENDQTETKYLSIHRGWWLKWVNHEPKKNGHFSIHAAEDVEGVSAETQNSYITLGGAFWLRHKRWNGYHVGVRAQESATFGGRMLGLYESAYKTDDEDGPDQEIDADGETGGKWMKPILFRVNGTSLNAKATTPRADSDAFSFDGQDSDEPPNELHLTTTNSSLDVPVWIELMHRSSRRRQLAYVVRVIVDSDDGVKEDEEALDSATVFSRIRSGRTLAQIIQTGLGKSRGEVDIDQDLLKPIKLRRSNSTEVPQKVRHNLDTPILEQNGDPAATPKKSPSEPLSPAPKSPRGSLTMPSELLSTPYQSDADEVGSFEDSGDEISDDMDMSLAYAEKFTPTRKPRKGRQIIDKISQSVKSSTSKTSKQVVRQSKKVGKGTVSAGKAIIGPMSRSGLHSKKPPMREPKVAKVAKPSARSSNRKTKKELLAVNRTMKRIGKKHADTWLSVPNVLAGQLSPPEQSLRTTSHALSRMSNAAPHTQLAKEFEQIANQQFAAPSELDISFLQGGAVQLGVVPPDDQPLLYDSLVARCLWESHWREEWCGIYEKSIVFFGPTSKQSSLQLSYVDITSLRSLGSNVFSPIPGYPILAIETSWQCYYLAFPDEESRDICSGKIDEQIKYIAAQEVPDDAYKNLWKARFWQGFQDSVDAAGTTGNHKWAKVPSGSNPQHRSLMNGRRMVFDVEPFSSLEETDVLAMDKIEAFVATLLNLALATTFDSLEANPAAFAEFLDMTSQLRAIPLDRIDLSNPAALCIFTNLFHCLLHHALLLAIHGPLHKKSVGHFFRTTCYEVGGDVFSLAELYHCVIRGNMSKPVSPKNPYLDVPKKSASYSVYSLFYTDVRMNFVLNTGDISCPQQVPVLRPDSLELQLQGLSRTFVKRQLSIDHNKRTILLPKICDVYRNDFDDYGDSSNLACLAFCVSLLETEERVKITTFMAGDSPYAVKFSQCAEFYHQFLSPVNHQHEEVSSPVPNDVA